MKFLKRMWASLNYRYCMSQRYLVAQQGSMIDAIQWERQAWEWKQKWMA